MTKSNTMYPAFQVLSGKRVILGSTSSSRISIFTQLGLDYELLSSNFEEDYDKAAFKTPLAYCAATCAKKAEIVLEMSSGTASLIVCADTIISCNGVIYEKPMDRADAVRILSELGGNTIEVITAVSFYYRTAAGYQHCAFEDVTLMHMLPYDDKMIAAYLDTGEGMSYSGALSYQGAGFLLVKGINGCFYNLRGFPAPRFYQEYAKIAHLIV
ncbi:Maf protein [Paramicrosporidium saccamoebae]|uniref:Maf protein n=1 Tax=Paramicrosporidium saccamoebae TaxID=1246581 RepID=A0A2H9TLQ3_9FUNG|nr:Maf protein [Paramicrosporidium saccamoebae]